MIRWNGVISSFGSTYNCASSTFKWCSSIPSSGSYWAMTLRVDNIHWWLEINFVPLLFLSMFSISWFIMRFIFLHLCAIWFGVLIQPEDEKSIRFWISNHSPSPRLKTAIRSYAISFCVHSTLAGLMISLSRWASITFTSSMIFIST